MAGKWSCTGWRNKVNPGAKPMLGIRLISGS
jgi:hypothetical protein